MKSRNFLIALLFFALVVIFFWLKANGKRSQFQKPTLSVAALSIQDIDPDRIKINSKMVLKNPLPIELSTKKFDYEVFMNDSRILESSYTKPISIESSDSAVVRMPFDVLTKSVANMLREIEDQKSDSALYTLKATATLDVPVLGQREFKFEESKRLPVFRLLKIKPEDIDIDKFSIKGSTIIMNLIVENPNVFAVKMEDADYNVTFGKDFVMRGTMDGVTAIPPKSSANVPMELRVKNGAIAKVAWKVLTNDDKTPFVIDFKCKLLSENKILDNSKMAMQTKGTIKELRDLSKQISSR